MKAYAVKYMTWIEGYYQVSEICEDAIFLNESKAEKYIHELELLDDDTVSMDIVKYGINFKVFYDSNTPYPENITKDNAEKILWEYEWAKWFYIQELDIQ